MCASTGVQLLMFFSLLFVVCEGRDDPNTTISQRSSALCWPANGSPVLNAGLVDL